MNRRELLKSTLAAGAALGLGGTRAVAGAAGASAFRLKYAPHFGMFKHHAGEDLVDQLKFGADQGFTAWEDNGMAGRPVEVQERLAKEMARLGMTMGVFVAMADFQNVTFASAKPEASADIVAKAKAAIEVAKRVNAKWTTVVPGRHDVGLEWETRPRTSSTT
jgi:sugar phosphate isomerase/epimerase